MNALQDLVSARMATVSTLMDLSAVNVGQDLF